MDDERLEQLLQAIASRISVLIGKALVTPHLKPAHQELLDLGWQVDDLINDYQSGESFTETTIN